jgi:hypothetical protein
MKICVSQIYEKPHSSKIVFTLFNQEQFAFCVLHKWYIKRYIKRYTTEQNPHDEKDFLTLCKFRTTNHKLPIEHGRWNNIPRENRKCNLCNLEEIGDEFHYILNCMSAGIDRAISFLYWILTRLH